jgi:hypothetical protein
VRAEQTTEPDLFLLPRVPSLARLRVRRYSFFGAADDEELVGELGGDMDDGGLVRVLGCALCARTRALSCRARKT